MKQKSLKIISFISAFAMLVAVFSLTVIGGGDTCYKGDNYTPIIIIHGEKTIYKENEDGTSTALFDDGEYVSEILDGAIPLIAQGILTGNWKPYSDHVLEVTDRAFDDFAPSPDGVIPSDTHGVLWTPDKVSAAHSDSSFYEYWPDVRLSPFDAAEDIAKYVNTVKAKTGHTKVNIVGRCEGSVFAMAYMYLYERLNGYQNVGSFILSDPTLWGVRYTEAIFSGTVHINATDVAAFIKIYDITSLVGDKYTEAVNTVIKILNDTYGIEITSSLLNRMYRELKDVLFAPLLRQYYARTLGPWGCVYSDFDKALEYIFPTAELQEEYAVIIEKAVRFHNEIALKSDEIITDMIDKGVSFADITEYGYPQYPLYDDACEIGNYLTGAKQKSGGATVSRMDSTLSESYIKDRTDAGYGQYISPDKQIDASTALFPNNTWFIKNVAHIFTPVQEYEFLRAFSRGEIGDIFSSETYPQFLNYDPDAPILIPAQEKNPNDVVIEMSFFEKVKAFFRNLIEKIRDLLSCIPVANDI